jgi:myosin heavy subunit
MDDLPDWFRKDLLSSVIPRIETLGRELALKFRRNDQDVIGNENDDRNFDLWKDIGCFLADNVNRYLMERRDRFRFFTSDNDFVNGSGDKNSPLRKFYTASELDYLVNKVLTRNVAVENHPVALRFLRRMKRRFFADGRMRITKDKEKRVIQPIPIDSWVLEIRDRLICELRSVEDDMPETIVRLVDKVLCALEESVSEHFLQEVRKRIICYVRLDKFRIHNTHVEEHYNDSLPSPDNNNIDEEEEYGDAGNYFDDDDDGDMPVEIETSTRIKELEVKVSELTDDNDLLEQMVTDQDEKISELEQEAKGLMEEISSVKRMVVDRSTKIEQLEQQLENVVEEKRNVDKMIKNRNEMIKDLNSQIETANQNQEKLKDEVSELKNALDIKEYEYQEEYNIMHNKYKKLKAIYENTKDKHDEMKTKFQRLFDDFSTETPTKKRKKDAKRLSFESLESTPIKRGKKKAPLQPLDQNREGLLSQKRPFEVHHD